MISLILLEKKCDGIGWDRAGPRAAAPISAPNSTVFDAYFDFRCALPSLYAPGTHASGFNYGFGVPESDLQ